MSIVRRVDPVQRIFARNVEIASLENRVVYSISCKPLILPEMHSTKVSLAEQLHLPTWEQPAPDKEGLWIVLSEQEGHPRMPLWRRRSFWH